MNTDAQLCAAWLEHARTGEVRKALLNLHAELASRVESKDPVCTASGRCCNFERFGHRLYTTGLEVALTLDLLPTERTLKPGDVDDALGRGTCPFVVDRLCGVHPVRPAGCRVYFCDTSAQLWVNELAEFAADEIKRIHDTYNIDYRYAEWRALLMMFQEAGIATKPSRPATFASSDPFVQVSVDRA